MTIVAIIKRLSELMKNSHIGIDKTIASRALLQSGITEVDFSTGRHKFAGNIKSGSQVQSEIKKNLSNMLEGNQYALFLLSWP